MNKIGIIEHICSLEEGVVISIQLENNDTSITSGLVIRFGDFDKDITISGFKFWPEKKICDILVDRKIKEFISLGDPVYSFLYRKKKLEYPGKVLEGNKDRFFGKGWDVSKVGDKYYFSYISGQLAGKENCIEISKEDFLLMKSHQMTFDEICRKYRAR